MSGTTEFLDIDAASKEAFDALFGALPDEIPAETKEALSTAAPGAEPTPQTPAETKAEPTGEVAEDEAAGQPAFVAKALKRVSEREKRIAEREKALEARERDAGKTKPEPEATKWTKAKIRANPAAYLRDEVGLNTGDVARALMAETLGDNAPPEYRAIASKLKEGGTRDEEIEDLREMIRGLQESVTSQEAKRAQASYVAEYTQKLDTYVNGDLKESPRVAQVYANDPQWTKEALWDVIRRDAADKQSRGAAADPMTPAEAVAALDKWLTRFVQVGPSGSATAPPQRKTLANAVPPVPPAPKDPTDFEVAEREARDWLLKQTAQ